MRVASTSTAGAMRGAANASSTAPANAVAACPAGNELEWTTYSGWIWWCTSNGRGLLVRSLTPNESASAAVVASAVRNARPIVPHRPRRCTTPTAIARTIQTAPSFSIVPSHTDGSFRTPTRCVDSQTTIRSSIALRLRGDVPEPRVDEAVHAVRDEADGRHAQQVRPVGRVRELLERTVDADRVLRVVVPGSLGEEDADEPEDDAACDVPGDSGTCAPPAPHRREAADAPLVLELPGEAAV